MQWKIHGERSLYESPWMRLRLVDVELPDGKRFEHHVMRAGQAAGTVVVDPERGVLLLWRHRFITDTWGWELPGGGIEPGEDPAAAAAREVLEETGWRPGPLTAMGKYHPSNGCSDQVFHMFMARGATHEGPPVDAHEAERIEWVSLAQAREFAVSGKILDGLTLTALLLAFQHGHLTLR